jgi:hypothetical protein
MHLHTEMYKLLTHSYVHKCIHSHILATKGCHRRFMQLHMGIYKLLSHTYVHKCIHSHVLALQGVPQEVDTATYWYRQAARQVCNCYVYMYIYIYIHIVNLPVQYALWSSVTHTCTHYVCVCIYIYIHTHTFAHMDMDMDIHTLIHTYIHGCIDFPVRYKQKVAMYIHIYV